MNTKNIGLIECGGTDSLFELNSAQELNGYSISKIYITGSISHQALQREYPRAQIVPDTHSIFQDHSIDLVVIRQPEAAHMKLVAAALQSGKNVSII